MLKPYHEFEFEGLRFNVYPLKAVDGAVVLARLVQVAGPAAFLAQSSTAVAASVMRRGPIDDTVEMLCLKFGRRTQIVGHEGKLVSDSGDTAMLDMHLGMRPDVIPVWLAQCIGYQFGPLWARGRSPESLAAWFIAMGLPDPTKEAKPTNQQGGITSGT